MYNSAMDQELGNICIHVSFSLHEYSRIALTISSALLSPRLPLHAHKIHTLPIAFHPASIQPTRTPPQSVHHPLPQSRPSTSTKPKQTPPRRRSQKLLLHSLPASSAYANRVQPIQWLASPTRHAPLAPTATTDTSTAIMIGNKLDDCYIYV